MITNPKKSRASTSRKPKTATIAALTYCRCSLNLWCENGKKFSGEEAEQLKTITAAAPHQIALGVA